MGNHLRLPLPVPTLELIDPLHHWALLVVQTSGIVDKLMPELHLFLSHRVRLPFYYLTSYHPHFKDILLYDLQLSLPQL